MKITNYLFIAIFFCFLYSNLQATTIFTNNNNKIDLIGDFNIAYFNKLKAENTLSFVKNNNYYSHIGLFFENKSFKDLSSILVFDVKVNNKFYYPKEIDKDYYKAIEINELYIELKDSNLSSTKLGNFKSQVILNTVSTTSKAYVFLLDAGYSFVGRNYNSIFNEEYFDSDYSTNKIYQGIGHYDKINNIAIAVELDSPREDIQARNSFEKEAFSRKYSAGLSVSYLGNTFGASVGYKRDQNKIKDNYIGYDFNNSIISADSFLSSAYLNLNKIYFAVSGGYYKNLKIAGVNHVGASAILQLKLTKLTPYIGYQFLYADGLNKINYINNLQHDKNYSFDQSMFLAGLSFKVYDGLILGIEHSNDIRSEVQTKTSLLNNINNDVTMLYVKYSF